MALRSLGSSLLAKTNPSSALRKSREERIEKPNVPGKGDVGSLERQFVEEPIERSVPEGSDKVLNISPGAEASQRPDVISGQPQVNLLPGNVGQTTPPVPGGARAGVQMLGFPRFAPTPAGAPSQPGQPAQQQQAQPTPSVLGAQTNVAVRRPTVAPAAKPSVKQVGNRSIAEDTLRSKRNPFSNLRSFGTA